MRTGRRVICSNLTRVKQCDALFKGNASAGEAIHLVGELMFNRLALLMSSGWRGFAEIGTRSKPSPVVSELLFLYCPLALDSDRWPSCWRNSFACATVHTWGGAETTLNPRGGVDATKQSTERRQDYKTDPAQEREPWNKRDNHCNQALLSAHRCILFSVIPIRGEPLGGLAMITVAQIKTLMMTQIMKNYWLILQNCLFCDCLFYDLICKALCNFVQKSAKWIKFIIIINRRTSSIDWAT